MAATDYLVEPALEYVPMSYEDWLVFDAGGRRVEWVDGVAIMMPIGPKPSHQRVSRRLAEMWEAALPDLWVETAVAIGLARNRVRIPDVLALPADPPGEIDEYWWELQPVMVAEVLSPSTRREDLIRKTPEYAKGKISQYWVVDREARTIEILGINEGSWERVVVIDDARPTAEVAVGEWGTVSVDLAAILDR